MAINGLFLFILNLCGVIGIFGTIFWIWMIIDCATHEPAEGQDKLAWILMIVLTHVIGASIYFFARRPTRIRITGR
ncbi:MAG TPA: PLDc N-terminal domain-containing protein [Ktedonobacteraceae bacterium]|nr:PLDc N-terminal domain-containing protein [Ktedonobacteraceae bacterium]